MQICFLYPHEHSPNTHLEKSPERHIGLHVAEQPSANHVKIFDLTSDFLNMHWTPQFPDPSIKTVPMLGTAGLVNKLFKIDFMINKHIS